jgi:hypothetical protein
VLVVEIVSALLGRFRCNRLYLLVVATLAIGLFENPALAGTQGSGSTQPVHLSIQGLEPQRLFVAGESGELKIDLSLIGTTMRFDPGQKTGTLRLSAPAESGIYFNGAHQSVFPVDVSRSASGVVSIQVPYSVDSLVRVKNYSLQMDLTVPLVSDQGQALQEGALITWPVRVETPLATKLIVLAILFIAIFLFVVEWVRVDVVAIMMMVSLPLLNLLDSRATFTGLSSNAVIAIIGVMIISAGLNKVGLVSRAVRPVIRAAGSSPNRLMVFLASLIAVISSVMQNTGAAVLFLPGIRHAAKKMKIPISRVLMPIGMCAILGGTLTMIGTSPLILLNDILPEGMEKFGLLDLTPIGFALALSGLIYFSTVGRVFLKKIAAARQEAGAQEDVDTFSYYHDLDGPFELRVPADWKHPGGPDTIVRIRKQYHVNIVCVADYVGVYDLAPPPDATIGPEMSLCAYGPQEAGPVQGAFQSIGGRDGGGGGVSALDSDRLHHSRNRFSPDFRGYRAGGLPGRQDLLQGVGGHPPAARGRPVAAQHLGAFQDLRADAPQLQNHHPAGSGHSEARQVQVCHHLLRHRPGADDHLQFPFPEAALQSHTAVGLPDAGRPGNGAHPGVGHP